MKNIKLVLDRGKEKYSVFSSRQFPAVIIIKVFKTFLCNLEGFIKSVTAQFFVDLLISPISDLFAWKPSPRLKASLSMASVDVNGFVGTCS